MLLMGDEIGRSQSGNNNAYCQDGEMNWLAWSGIPARDMAFCDFLSKVIRIRRSRPLLRQRTFLHGQPVNGAPDVRWLRPDGETMQQGDWDGPFSRSLAVQLSGETENLLILINAHHESVAFMLRPPLVAPWRRLIDTKTGIATAAAGVNLPSGLLSVGGRSLQLLESPA